MANPVRSIVLKYIQSIGAEIYAESQRIVPVRSGALKESGSLKYTSDGVSIKYTAPYASNLVGNAETDPNYKYIVREHQRRLPSGGQTTVKQHMRPMGIRPTRMTGNMQTSSGFSYTKDNNFLLTAMTNVTKNKGTLLKLIGLNPSMTIE
jgi:hypothetical protein